MSQLPARQSELDPQRPIVAVCRSGNRSGQATATLAHAGYDAHNLDGGMQGWAAAGLPYVSEDDHPARVA